MCDGSYSKIQYSMDEKTWRHYRRLQKIENDLEALVRATKDYYAHFELTKTARGYSGYISFSGRREQDFRTKYYSCIGDAVADLVKFVDLMGGP